MRKILSDVNGTIAPLKARQAEIRRLVEAKGFVTIDYLAREFNATPQTIRRDVNTLSKRGLINLSAKPPLCIIIVSPTREGVSNIEQGAAEGRSKVFVPLFK